MAHYKNKKSRGYRTYTILIGVAVILVVALALALYSRAPTSNTVYCGILQYVEFPAQTIIKGQPVNQTVTMTTSTNFFTTTTPGPVGRTFANSTTSTSGTGYSAGVETICRYVSTSSK
jgi:hypothetical protein